MNIKLKCLLAWLVFSIMLCARPGLFAQKQFDYDTIVWLPDSVPMHFILVPEGSYRMGSPEAEPNRDPDEGPQHEVIISRSFFVGVFEVTQKQFETVMNFNPSVFRKYAESPRHPVESVTWNDAVEFINRLNRMGTVSFRLPTEAEWEYACRAGTHTPYYWGHQMSANGQSDYAWANSRSMAMTHPVGEKKANPWGLYDMSGNVWEWCSDWYAAYEESSEVDPKGPNMGKNKVFRGGSWYDFYESHRCANRHRHAVDIGYTAIGFRVVMEAK